MSSYRGIADCPLTSPPHAPPRVRRIAAALLGSSFVVLWEFNFRSYQEPGPDEALLPGLVSASLLCGNETLPVSNLTHPVLITLPVNVAEAKRIANQGDAPPKYSCEFWDKGWQGDGCYVYASPNDAGARDDVLVCACTHLTVSNPCLPAHAEL